MCFISGGGGEINLINKCSRFSFPYCSRCVYCSTQKQNGAVWGSWLTSVGFWPQHINPVVDVEEKDAGGSWLIFFLLFFSLSGALYECFDIFPATSCFSKLICLRNLCCSA